MNNDIVITVVSVVSTKQQSRRNIQSNVLVLFFKLMGLPTECTYAGHYRHYELARRDDAIAQHEPVTDGTRRRLGRRGELDKETSEDSDHVGASPFPAPHEPSE